MSITFDEFEKELQLLYVELMAVRDFEVESPEQHERFDDLIARFRPNSVGRIEDLRSIIASKGHTTTDRAALILLIAICFSVEVGAKEKSLPHIAARHGQASSLAPNHAYSRRTLH